MKRINTLFICAMTALALTAVSCDDDSDKKSSGNTENSGGNTGGNGNTTPEIIDVNVVRCDNTTCKATCCGDVCRDTTSNANHCGACGNVCDSDEICQNGHCVADPYLAENAVCYANEKKCGGICTDVMNNNDNCGECGNVCLEGTKCHNGDCVVDCGRQTVCNNTCTDLLSDGENCGKCGEACDADAYCQNATCQYTCADQNQVVCNHTCTSLESDIKNCGACGTVCETDETCRNGLCTTECSSELETVCDQKCVNTKSDNDNCGECGIKCDSNQYCSDGTCVDTCADTSKTICDHACIDVQTNKDNCGECGNRCAATEICQNGECGCPANDPYCNVPKPTCDSNEKLCGITCVDTKTDRLNCGTCGHDCGEGNNCVNGKCIDCNGKTTCEDGACYDTQNDPNNCGGCGIKCPSNVACTNGTCAGCTSYYVDCDGDPTNGCETTSDKCECQNGQTKSCYYGPAGTQGVGACKAGTITCTNNKWGECVGMVVPVVNTTCMAKPGVTKADATNDLNCDGKIDGTEDFDKDGYTICNGDCCDTSLQPGCNVADPSKINPGIYETIGNKIDDNCNGQIDEAPSTCTASYNYGTDLSKEDARNAAGIQLARAMDICDDASVKGYGLVSATVQSTNSTTRGNSSFGYAINVFDYLSSTSAPTTPIVKPLLGSSFAGMASGYFRNGNLSDSNSFISGGTIPSVYLNAHGGKLQSATGCSTGNSINDSVNLHLELKAPTNATGFSFSFRFFSHEYPTWVCTYYNDFFLALLTSKAQGIPADHNIVFDKVGNPVSINNAFFTSCAPISCNSNSDCATGIYTKGCVNNKCTSNYGACPDGTTGLRAFSTSGSGGATAWLTTQAPVVGGETFTLDFYIWDTNDSSLDSAAIIDNFKWITTAGTVEVSTDFSDGRT